MESTVETHGRAKLIRLSGPLDVNGSIELRDPLGRDVDTPSARVLVDLAGVTLIDSSGIGVLIGAHRPADQQGAWFALAAPGAAVSKILSLTQVDRLLQVFASVPEALDARP